MSGTSPSLPDWLTAVGTILAVVVALFIAFYGALRRRRDRPILSVEFDNREPFCRHAKIE